jgi:hypothetical protein
MELYTFQTGFLSIISSLALYTQQYAYVSITCMTYTYCGVYSAEHLMMDRETVRNIQFYSKNKFEN